MTRRHGRHRGGTGRPGQGPGSKPGALSPVPVSAGSAAEGEAADLAQARLAQAMGAGVAHHRAGRLSEAEDAYRQVLEAWPQHPDALHLLGVIAHQVGRHERAAELIADAIEIDATVADYHDNLGNALSASGRPDQAAACHRRAVALRPDFAQAWYNLGNTLDTLDRPAAAAAAYTAAIAVRPDYARAHFNLGNVLRRLNRLEEASAAYRRVLVLEPAHAGAATNLGRTCSDLGRFKEAVAWFRRLYADHSTDPRICYNLGSALHQSGALEEAELLYRRTLMLDDGHAEAVNNLGSVLYRLGRPQQAEPCHRRALALRPDYADAHFNLANALQALGRRREADASLTQALRLDPRSSKARFNRSLLHLAEGRLLSGWDGYQARFAAGEALPDRQPPATLWRGEPLGGRRLLIWREQGVGDEIMFATGYREAIERAGPGATVILEADPRLVSLLARSFPRAAVRAERADSLRPDYDFHLPAGGLPGLFRSTYGAFSGAGSCLTPDPARVALWRQRLAALGDGPKIGICWRSRLITEDRRPSYTRLEQWRPVLTIPGVRWVNLQYDRCETELTAAERAFGITIARWPDLDLHDDFEAAAALISALDLVITAPTSVGELAGAVGTPVWRFGLEGDWTTLGTGIRPWFATMRTFLTDRDRSLDDVLAKIAFDLRRGLAAEKTGSGTAATPVMPAAGPEPERKTVIEPEAAMTDSALEDLIERAVADHRAGRLAEAEAGYRRVLAARPEQFDALHLLGLLHHQTGRNASAVGLIVRALERSPLEAQALTHLGLALQALDRFDQAMVCFRNAIALRPQAPDPYTNLGKVLKDAGGDAADAEAEACHRRALALNPDLAAAHTNLGHIHETRGHLAAAEGRYRRALTLNPRQADTWNNLGTVLNLQARVAEAEACFRQALAIDSDYPLTAWNLGLIDLARGELERGWAGYARRFGARQLQRGRQLPVPLWTGEPLAGRRLLVWNEQGLGDELLFATCYPDLFAQGGRFVLECDRRLVTLFRRSFPQVEGVRAESVDGRGRETLADCGADLHCPAGSLPALLRSRFDRFSLRPPVLVPDPERVARWRDRLAALGPEPKIGICWRSRLMTALRAGNYSRLDQWQPVLTVPGVRFVNLQYDECEAELCAAERRFGVTIARWSNLDLTNDLEEAAALTAGLDLVITAPTSVGEMAGALGVPVWRFDGERDWTLLGTHLRPWFWSMQLIFAGDTRSMDDALAEAGQRLRTGLVLQVQEPSGSWSGAGATPLPAGGMAVSSTSSSSSPVPSPSPTNGREGAKVESADPRYLEALLVEATAHHQAMRVEDAEKYYLKVLDLDPDQPVALHLLGWLAYQVGQKDLAIQLIEKSLAREPGYVAALTNLGTILSSVGRFEDAATLFRRALARRPEAPDVLTNLGNALGGLGRWAEAEDCHRRALACGGGGSAMIYANLGAALWRQGRLAEAETVLRQALGIDAGYAPALATLGTVLRSQADYPAAADCYRRALALDDTLAEAWSDLGRVQAETGRRREAETCFARALALTPELASAWFNRGLMHLAGGDLARGWEGHDWRFRDNELRLAAHPSPAPEWRGEALDGRRLLVWREQGLGDELMFASCYAELIRRAGHCIIECDPRLASLFVRAFPQATIRAAGAPARGAAIDHDYQIAAGSLPRLLRPDLASFGYRGAYLAAEPGRALGWRARLAALGPGAKVGICWRSRLNTAERAGSYTRLEQWRPVLTLPGVRLVNLQYDDCAAELDQAERRFGVKIARWLDADLTNDLETAAALISALDLVITVPTSVGELAGALGVPVWRLEGPRSWTTLGTAVRPWFPSMRLFLRGESEAPGDLLPQIARQLLRRLAA